jgi:hypothetical protein
MEIVANSKPLTALVCGFEHSGTTLVSEMLRQHPDLDSGFEGGFLLNEEVQDFLKTEPFYSNTKNGWGISDEDLQYICAASTWPGVYHRLKERASVIKNKDVLLFDKTPRYMQVLDQVLERVPNTRCIVTVKDFRSVMWSSFKRTNFTIDEWYKKRFEVSCNHTLSYAKGWTNSINKGFAERILLVQYENLCLNPVEQGKKIFQFLGLNFEDSYLHFQNVRYQHVYGNNVSTQYLKEYQENLPEYICQETLTKMQEYKDWFWL